MSNLVFSGNSGDYGYHFTIFRSRYHTAIAEDDQCLNVTLIELDAQLHDGLAQHRMCLTLLPPVCQLRGNLSVDEE